MFETVWTSIVYGVPMGLAGTAIAHYFDKFVHARGWRGWSL